MRVVTRISVVFNSNRDSVMKKRFEFSWILAKTKRNASDESEVRILAKSLFVVEQSTVEKRT